MKCRRFGFMAALIIQFLFVATIIYHQVKLLSLYLINDSSQSLDFAGPPQDKKASQIYYIHIGKAGGLTLYHLLDIVEKMNALPCRINVTTHNTPASLRMCYRGHKGPEPALSNRVIAHFHLVSPLYTAEQKQWLLDNTDAFLFPVRDPVDRVVSAFNFHYHNAFQGKPKPRNNYSCPEFGKLCLDEVFFYLDCFGTVEDLAQSVAPSPDPLYNYTIINAATDTCRTLGTKVLQGFSGKGPPNWATKHLYFNYRYYLSKTIAAKPQHQILAVRTEHMWDDIRQLEESFGGDADQTLAHFMDDRYSHGSEEFILQSGVSSLGRRSLCCALYDDMDAYQQIILGAANLNDMQKKETLLLLYQKCGIKQTKFAEDFIAYPFSWVEWHQKACTNANFY